MQSADDVKLGDRFAPAAPRVLPGLLQGHGVRLGVLGFLAERAQLATRYAHVGGVDVAVDIKESAIAVETLADLIGEPADTKQIGRAVERYAFVISEPFAGFHLGANRLQACVFKD